jgi:tRNA modification GTPase
VDLSSTIIAVATGHAPSPRSLVRISGEHTRAALACLVPDMQQLDAGAHVVRIVVPGAAREDAPVELPARVLMFVAPRSYTGEDAAELQLVGQTSIVARVMNTLCAHEHGRVRPALPGEFTARAVLRGKLRPDQAESVQALIVAASQSQLRAADRVLSGESGAAYRALADELATALALVEAGIDFTDQDDVVAIAPSELLRRVTGVARTIEAMLGPTPATAAPTHTPRVALAGAPNAGKSTLFNALLGRERTVVSSVAGTTRDIVEEPLDLRGSVAGVCDSAAVTLVDIAGMDDHAHAAGHVDAMAQRAASDAVRHADVLVWCDPTGAFAPPPWPDHSATIIRVRTKADIPAMDAPAAPQHLGVCALDGWNLGALRRAIADAAFSQTSHAQGSATLLPRHARHLAAAHAALERVRTSLARRPDAAQLDHPEIAAGALREALDELGQITGAIAPDDIIGRIFATFCIGK